MLSLIDFHKCQEQSTFKKSQNIGVCASFFSFFFSIFLCEFILISTHATHINFIYESIRWINCVFIFFFLVYVSIWLVKTISWWPSYILFHLQVENFCCQMFYLIIVSSNIIKNKVFHKLLMLLLYVFKTNLNFAYPLQNTKMIRHNFILITITK